jgi:hypothetical protein
MLKFGLLLVLANIFLKLFIGIGLWKMAMENKSRAFQSSNQFEGQVVEDPNYMRGQNEYAQGRIFPNSGSNNKFELRESGEDE